MVVTEYLTKWPEAWALPNAKAALVASFFYENIICCHRCLKELLTDQGTHFVNELLQAMCKRVGVKHRLFTAYHPQKNGLVERFNKTLCEILAKYSEMYKEDWDVFLPSALFAYRTIRQNTTQYEPFYLTYGREATLPIELELVTYPPEVSPEVTLEEACFQRIAQLTSRLVDDRQTQVEWCQIGSQSVNNRVPDWCHICVEMTQSGTNLTARLVYDICHFPTAIGQYDW